MLPVAPGRVDNWDESGDGESRIEWDTEKANWKKRNQKKKPQQAITGWFTFFLFTRHFALLLLTTCVAEKIYLGLPFSLPLTQNDCASPPPEFRSNPASSSSIFIPNVSLSLTSSL